MNWYCFLALGILQEDSDKDVGSIFDILEKYELDGLNSTVEVDAKIAHALEVSLDYLAGNSKNCG